MPDGNAAAQRVLGIAKVLKECSCDVRFCGLAQNQNINIRDEGCIEGFHYINYPYPSTVVTWLKYLLGRDFSINEIKNYKPDIVILYNHPAFAIDHITNYCYKHNIKVIADITEWYVPYGNLIFKLIKGYDTQRRMYSSHLKLDGLICISSYLSNFYENKGKLVIEVPPLTDISQSKWHQNYYRSDVSLKIVYAGSPADNKDRLDLILNAMDDIWMEFKDKFHFEVFGLTLEEYRKKWGDKELRTYVTFRGRLPHKEIIGELLSADFQIFLRPATLQNLAGFPTKFVETITSGTLPITNLSSNLSQYIVDGENGFIIEDINKEAIKNTLRRVIGLSRETIDDLKNKLDTCQFHYSAFIEDMNKFLCQAIKR